MSALDDLTVIRSSLDRLRRMEESRGMSTAKTRGALQATNRIESVLIQGAQLSLKILELDAQMRGAHEQA